MSKRKKNSLELGFHGAFFLLWRIQFVYFFPCLCIGEGGEKSLFEEKQGKTGYEIERERERKRENKSISLPILSLLLIPSPAVLTFLFFSSSPVRHIPAADAALQRRGRVPPKMCQRHTRSSLAKHKRMKVENCTDTITVANHGGRGQKVSLPIPFFALQCPCPKVLYYYMKGSLVNVRAGRGAKGKEIQGIRPLRHFWFGSMEKKGGGRIEVICLLSQKEGGTT